MAKYHLYDVECRIDGSVKKVRKAVSIQDAGRFWIEQDLFGGVVLAKNEDDAVDKIKKEYARRYMKPHL